MFCASFHRAVCKLSWCQSRHRRQEPYRILVGMAWMVVSGTFVPDPLVGPELWLETG